MIRRLFAALLATALALGPAAARNVVAADHVAVDDAYFVYEDQLLAVPQPGILANDAHDPGTSTCVAAFDPTGLDGALGGSTDGSFTLTPVADWNGNTAFHYEIGSLSAGTCSDTLAGPATVTIEVRPVNDAPTAVLASMCDGGVSVAEDSGAFTDPGHCTELQSVGPLDEANQALEAWVVSTTNPGLFASGPSISVVDDTFGRLHFTPASNAHGSATVSVQGRDSGGTANGGADLSPAVTFTLTITPKNDRPTATSDSFIVLADRTLNVRAPGVLFNDSDVDGDTITAVKVTSPAHGVVTLAPDGAFSYTPATGYLGVDTFRYLASDGTASSPTRIVTLSVTAIPTPSPTPVPTAGPTSEPSPEPTIAEPSPSASIEVPASEDPGPSPTGTALASATASARPGATPVPGPAAGSGGGLSLPALLLIVLLAVLLAFGAAIFVPRWLTTLRTGQPPDDEA